MKTVSLSGSPRENVGKKDAKGLRKQGLVPCVAYGSGEQIHFYLDERDFANIVFLLVLVHFSTLLSLISVPLSRNPLNFIY